MIKVSNNCISMTRGDTCSLVINVVNNLGESYALQEGEYLHFNLRKDTQSTTDIIHKILNGNALSLELADTLNLECGVYVYDVSLVTNTKNRTILQVLLILKI